MTNFPISGFSEVPVLQIREYVRLLDRGADRLPLPYAPRATFQAMLALLDRYACPTCRLTPDGAVPEPCGICITGMMRARIHELEGEFHQDWLRHRWVARCGHSGYGTRTEGTPCPFCELSAKGRPKNVVHDVMEAL